MSDRVRPRPPADREPVVITGVGAVSPLGNSLPDIATGLIAGRSGIRAIDPGAFAREPRQFAAPVIDIPVPLADLTGLDATAFAGLDRLEQLCLSASAAALADAGLRPAAAGSGGPRIGLVVGLGAEHLKRWESDFLAGGTRVFEPHRDRTIVHALARRLQLRGPAVTVAAACASSGYAMAMGRSWIHAGWVDACVVGGCDILSPTAIAAFYNLRALSRRNDEPAKASRPFDKARDGFVMGEGGAFFVLERHAAAVARGARRHAELAGVGMSSDMPYGQGAGPYGGELPGKAEGGETDSVPIVAAGGEYVLSPEEVRMVGQGDLEVGHKVLDEFVKRYRKETINTLKKLPGPKKD